MSDRLKRQIPLLPETEKLKEKTVAVIGIGGVGGSAAAALVRAGVGKLILCDHDVFEETNLNRQIFAFEDTLGKSKTESAREYLKRISGETEITLLDTFLSEDNLEKLFSLNPDFVVDAIDTVSSKKMLVRECVLRGVPVISSMGTGNRLDPSKLKLGDIKDTIGQSCPLAKLMRKELKKEGIEAFPVVFSEEIPIKESVGEDHGKHSPASAVFVPQSAGILMASYVVIELCK